MLCDAAVGFRSTHCNRPERSLLPPATHVKDESMTWPGATVALAAVTASGTPTVTVPVAGTVRAVALLMPAAVAAFTKK